MKIDKNKGKFSAHALQRADQQKLSCGELVTAWYRSTTYELSKKEQAYKFQTYGMESLDDFYTYDKNTRTIFTCHNLGDFILIITVTHKIMTHLDKKEAKNE